MKLYEFKKESGHNITHFDSNFIITRILRAEQAIQIGCAYLEKDGIIGNHQTDVPQLLLVIKGQGHVKGKEDKFVKIQTGEAVFWEKDEWHETRTNEGLTAIIIEGKGISPIFLNDITSSLVEVDVI